MYNPYGYLLNDSDFDILTFRPVNVLRYDRHWVPNVDGTLGQGILDWDLIASYVAKAPLELPADFEVMISGKDGSREDEFRQLVECHRQAELFYEKVLSYK